MTTPAKLHEQTLHEEGCHRDRPRLWLARWVGMAGWLLVAAAPMTQAAELRGFASAGPLGVILFQPCEGPKLSARTLQIDDRTPDTALSAGITDVRQIMLDSGRPLYVEFLGNAAGQVVTAQRFWRAVGTVTACSEVATSPVARLRASGEEPGWRLTVTATEARFERMGAKPVRFPAAPFLAAKGNPRVIDAWSAVDGGTVRVEVSEQMCSDGRSETASGAVVTLRYGSQTYEGCADRF
jgi:uncharacterized membrane protein